MQMSIHYREEDQYLVDKVEELAGRKRMSKSALILSILEEYFEAEKRLGQILRDMDAVQKDQLQQALQVQRENANNKKIGEIMLENNYVDEEELHRALQVQG